MSNDDALQQLQDLLKLNTELLQAQNRANELKSEELRLQSESLKNEQGRIDLERQNKALQREALNRAERRLQEVLQRYAGLAERVEILINYAQKNLFKDDAFRDILSNISERFEEIERAMNLILIDKLDTPHLKMEAERTIDRISNNLDKTSKQRQLLSYRKSLNRLKERQAEGEDDLRLLNQIDNINLRIGELEKELSKWEA